MNQEYMKTRKILPLVLSMSLPMVISMAVNALYNIVAVTACRWHPSVKMR